MSVQPADGPPAVDLTPTLPPFTVREAAPILNFSVDAVYDAVVRGEIRALRLGRAIRIPRGEVARLLQCEGPAPTADPIALADCSATQAGESHAG